MTQLNTPYPATAYLVGFLRQHATGLGLSLAQADLALELFLHVFSRAGIERVRDELSARAARLSRRRAPAPPSVAQFLGHPERYVATIDPVIRFLQGRDPALALRIVGRELLPE